MLPCARGFPFSTRYAASSPPRRRGRRSGGVRRSSRCGGRSEPDRAGNAGLPASDHDDVELQGDPRRLRTAQPAATSRKSNRHAREATLAERRERPRSAGLSRARRIRSSCDRRCTGRRFGTCRLLGVQPRCGRASSRARGTASSRSCALAVRTRGKRLRPRAASTRRAGSPSASGTLRHGCPTRARSRSSAREASSSSRRSLRASASPRGPRHGSSKWCERTPADPSRASRRLPTRLLARWRPPPRRSTPISYARAAREPDGLPLDSGTGQRPNGFRGSGPCGTPPPSPTALPCTFRR